MSSLRVITIFWRKELQQVVGGKRQINSKLGMSAKRLFFSTHRMRCWLMSRFSACWMNWKASGLYSSNEVDGLTVSGVNTSSIMCSTWKEEKKQRGKTVVRTRKWWFIHEDSFGNFPHFLALFYGLLFHGVMIEPSSCEVEPFLRRLGKKKRTNSCCNGGRGGI